MKSTLFVLLLCAPPLMALTTFDRTNIIDAEGYWAQSINIENDFYRGRYPFPQPMDQAWEGKREFLDKLYKIEALACDEWNNPDCRIIKICFKGIAPSRLEQNVWVGNCEYRDRTSNISWTDGFSWYYVEKFNVKPSKQFYDYVMNFNPKESDIII